MSLSQLILIYMGQVPEKGNEAAAAVATADLGAQDAYAILAIIESLDPQVSKTWGVHVDLLQHARNYPTEAPGFGRGSPIMSVICDSDDRPSALSVILARQDHRQK